MGDLCAHRTLPEGDWIVKEMLKVAMEDEKNANSTYRSLAREANYYRDRKRIFAIADDEAQHARFLSHIYLELFGDPLPKVRLYPRRRCRFDRAVGKAIAGEYESISFYQELLGRLKGDEEKNIVRSIMAEEQSHAHILEDILGRAQKK